MLGYLPQEFGVFPKVSAQELLNQYYSLHFLQINRKVSIRTPCSDIGDTA